MTAWLLDTNVLSELRKPKPNQEVVRFVSKQPLETLWVSSVTFAEIRFGIEMVPEHSKRDELSDWLVQRVRPMFEGRVLPVCEEVMLRWRLLVEVGRKSGHTFPQPDLIIAATALQHDLTLVTRDSEDFRKTSVRLLNPWLRSPQ